MNLSPNPNPHPNPNLTLTLTLIRMTMRPIMRPRHESNQPSPPISSLPSRQAILAHALPRSPANKPRRRDKLRRLLRRGAA